MNEIHLSELEADIMGVMVKWRVFDDEDVIHELMILAEKLKRRYV